MEWANVTTLVMHSNKGRTFRNRNKPIFKNLTNLKILGIHALRLGEIDKETFLGLTKLHTLDMSYNINLNFLWLKQVFVLKESLENLKNLYINFIESPVMLDKSFFDFLIMRRIQNLNLSGLAISKIQIDTKTLSELCSSIETFNISNILYTSKNYLTDPANFTLDTHCASLKILDISGFYFTSLQRFLQLERDTHSEHNVECHIEWLTFLETLYIDSLYLRVPIKPFTLTFNGTLIRLQNCRHDNLKRLFFRRNHIKWLNITCIGCSEFPISYLDLSSNGLEYISPNTLRQLTTLEEIILHHNQLHVMESYHEFEGLFVTFIKLKKICLSKNGLVSLPKYIFDQNPNLEYLDLSYNYLTTISFSLRNLNKLVSLDVRNNKLTFLNEYTFASFSSFVQQRFEDTTVDFNLDIGGNYFSCSCEGFQLIKWLYVYLIPKLNKSQQLKCVMDGDTTIIDNKAVAESHHHCAQWPAIIASVILTFVLFLAVITVVAFLALFIRRKQRHKIRQDFIYRFVNYRCQIKYLIHIIYCSKDYAFLQTNVTHRLSRTFNQLIGAEDIKLISEGFKEYRFGFDVYCEAEASIRQSAAVVVLISNNLCGCVRCKRELQMAFNKDKTIAVILKEDMNRENISPLLETVMKTAVSASLVRVRNAFHLKPDVTKFCKHVLDLVAVKET